MLWRALLAALRGYRSEIVNRAGGRPFQSTVVSAVIGARLKLRAKNEPRSSLACSKSMFVWTSPLELEAARFLRRTPNP
jgi:hypothetical protein